MHLWDGFIRIFHWAQALLIPALWWTAEEGEMVWHLFLAYLLLALWLVRLLWGLWGSETARFSQFVHGPQAFVAYLRGRAPHRPGHNPAGAYMVVALLLVTGVQLISGLFASDGIFTEGPWAAYAGEWGEALTRLHHQNFNLLLALIAVHVVAVLVYALRGERLVPAMIHGGSVSGVRQRHGGVALALAVAVWGLLLWGFDVQMPW